MNEVEALKQIIIKNMKIDTRMKEDCIYFEETYGPSPEFRHCTCMDKLFVKGEEDRTMCETCRLWDNYIPCSATDAEKEKAIKWQNMPLMDQPHYYDYFLT